MLRQSRREGVCCGRAADHDATAAEPQKKDSDCGRAADRDATAAEPQTMTPLRQTMHYCGRAAEKYHIAAEPQREYAAAEPQTMTPLRQSRREVLYDASCNPTHIDVVQSRGKDHQLFVDLCEIRPLRGILAPASDWAQGLDS